MHYFEKRPPYNNDENSSRRNSVVPSNEVARGVPVKLSVESTVYADVVHHRGPLSEKIVRLLARAAMKQRGGGPKERLPL